MMRPRFVVWMFSVCMTVLGAGVVSGQTYPNQPIRMITIEVGGSADFAARLIAQGLTQALGQQLIVENRGGNVAIPAGTLTKAMPNGYTVALFGSSVWTATLMQTASYDPVRDFSPITLVDRSPNIFVVHPSVPVKSVKGLIALAKAKPGQLNYSTGAIGGITHLAAELFKSMAGVNIVRIAYKGGGPALNDLIAGQVQLMFATPASVVPQIKARRVMALAVTSAAPFALFPDLPTVAAAGVPGYEAESTHSIFAPAGTPQSIINRLNDEIARVLGRADIKEKFLNAGMETVGSSPEQLTVTMKSEMVRMGKVIKDAGIRAE